MQRSRRFSLSISIPNRRSSVIGSNPSQTSSRLGRAIRRILRMSPRHVSSDFHWPMTDTDYMYDEDIDISYEGLLRLAARIGDAKPRNLPHDIRSSLPRSVYKDCRAAQLEQRCPICLDQYDNCDTVLGISECEHYFHASCLEKWLDMAKNCPVCRRDIQGDDICPSSPLSLSTSTAPTLSNGSPNPEHGLDYLLPYDHMG